MSENVATDLSSSNKTFSAADEITALLNDWDKAEEWIKKGGKIKKYILHPSIHEMWCAGRQLVEVYRSQKSSEQEFQIHLLAARQHLTTARHNVVDTLVGYFIESSNDILKDIREEDLKQHFDGYEEFFGLLKDVLEKIDESPENTEKNDNVYEEILNDDLPKLNRLHTSLTASVPAIKKIIKKKSARFFTDRVITIVSIIITIGLAIFTFVF